MDGDNKKIIDEMFARLTVLEEKIREIRTTFLVSLENELHDLTSGSVRRKLDHLALVKFPVNSSPNSFLQSESVEIRTVNRELLDKRVEDLELSVRTANCLYQPSVLEGPPPSLYYLGSASRSRKSRSLRRIHRIGDLIIFTPRDLLKLKNFGKKCLMLLMNEMGLSLGAVHIDWVPSPDSAKPEDIGERA
jgi:hypothetical protein